jgi:hypothetical protein
MDFIAAILRLGARTSQTRKEVKFRLPYEHCKSEVCSQDHMRVMLNGIHAGGLAAIEVTVVDGLEG